MTNYKEKKERAQQLAQDWQANFNGVHSWEYVLTWSARWERIGRKYGLLKEFKENGIL